MNLEGDMILDGRVEEAFGLANLGADLDFIASMKLFGIQIIFDFDIFFVGHCGL